MPAARFVILRRESTGAARPLHVPGQSWPGDAAVEEAAIVSNVAVEMKERRKGRFDA